MAHHDQVPNTWTNGQAGQKEYLASGVAFSGVPILCVSEDLPYAQQIIVPPLRSAGFSTDIVPAAMVSVVSAMRTPRVLVLFDVCSRSGGIYGICAEVRGAYQVPIMLILHSAARNEILNGYHAGADVCMLAPFDPRELLARLSGLLRRHSSRCNSPEICPRDQ